MAGLNTLQRAFNSALRTCIEACNSADAEFVADPSAENRAASDRAHALRRRLSLRRNRDGARKARAARIG